MFSRFFRRSPKTNASRRPRRLTIERMEERRLLATFTVTNLNDSGAGSLRDAITSANAAGGADTIDFNISGGGTVKTINLLSALPSVTEPTTIDGTTQSGFAGTPVIELNGTSAGLNAIGLHLTGGSSTVRGLIINRFNGDGIRFDGNSGNVLEGSYIGTNAAGTAAAPNLGNGVFIRHSASNRIGGSTASQRNLISGNSDDAVDIQGQTSTGNQVIGNYIGTDATGVNLIPNQDDGVDIDNGSSNTVENNLIVGGDHGIDVKNTAIGVQAVANNITGNRIFGVADLPIDLNADGPTPNDAGDVDEGPNRSQNFPVITTITSSSGNTTISGALQSAPSTLFRLEFFSGRGANAGQAETFLGSSNVTTNVSGTVSFAANLAVTLNSGDVITATATDVAGNTSEFAVGVRFGAPIIVGLPAVVRGGEWFLRTSLDSGPATVVFGYGLPTDTPLFGDWDGDGVKSPGVFRNGQFFLRNSNTTGGANVVLSFGLPTDTPIVGDWNGDGIDTIGVFRNGEWHLRNTNSTGPADAGFIYGMAGDLPVVGDWNGDGADTPGILRTGAWHLRNSNTTGVADVTAFFGVSTDTPIVGDWNGDGTDTIGIVRGSNGGALWFVRNTNTTGVADQVFGYGVGTDSPRIWGITPAPGSSSAGSSSVEASAVSL